MAPTPAQPARPALKQRKKNPFIEAYVRHGTISSAAQAVGISRFVVIDWRRNDPAFARAFDAAMNLSRGLADDVHERVKQLWSKIGMDSGKVSRSPLTADCNTPVGSLKPIGVAACGT